MSIYVKLTDKYIYVYYKKLKIYNSKYIKNGKVDNPYKLISYLNNILNFLLIKRTYIFILDTLLCNSDIFVYKYVFEKMGLLDYRIITDIDIVKKYLNEENIIIMNWSSSTNYCYKNNDEIIISKFNLNVINKLNKKYILLCGDVPLIYRFNKKTYKFEDEMNVIFNYLEKS